MWWTRLHETDSQHEISARIHDILCRLRYRSEASSILVGHSLFFRELFRLHLSPSFRDTDPTLAASLCNEKLNNASVVRVELSWKQGVRCIQDVSLVYGNMVTSHRETKGLCGFGFNFKKK